MLQIGPSAPGPRAGYILRLRPLITSFLSARHPRRAPRRSPISRPLPQGATMLPCAPSIRQRPADIGPETGAVHGLQSSCSLGYTPAGNRVPESPQLQSGAKDGIHQENARRCRRSASLPSRRRQTSGRPHLGTPRASLGHQAHRDGRPPRRHSGSSHRTDAGAGPPAAGPRPRHGTSVGVSTVPRLRGSDAGRRPRTAPRSHPRR